MFGRRRKIAGDKVLTPEDINQTEWSNPQNWTGPKLFGTYSSKTDKRLWVPKRIPSLGWTLNVGHPGGLALLVGILVGAAGLLIGACILLSIIIGVGVAFLRH